MSHAHRINWLESWDRGDLIDFCCPFGAVGGLRVLAGECTMLLYVSSEKSVGTRDGRSLDSAFRRILHAIHVAEPDDIIVIVPGVYDQDLAKRIAAARATGVSVTVAGSETRPVRLMASLKESVGNRNKKPRKTPGR